MWRLNRVMGYGFSFRSLLTALGFVLGRLLVTVYRLLVMGYGFSFRSPLTAHRSPLTANT
jgi:hypothetical protein